MSLFSLLAAESEKQGWNDQTTVAVLMDFLDGLVIDGKITSDDFYEFLQSIRPE